MLLTCTASDPITSMETMEGSLQEDVCDKPLLCAEMHYCGSYSGIMGCMCEPPFYATARCPRERLKLLPSETDAFIQCCIVGKLYGIAWRCPLNVQ